MHKVVVDTNVVVSSIIGRSYPYLIIYELIFQSKVELFCSSQTIVELGKVLAYPKFKKIKNFENDSKIILRGFRRHSNNIEPSSHIELSIDPSDNKFIDLALSASVDFLITGNLKHFPFNRIENTEVISPEKYWNTYWK